jgi:hypothetical protein
VAAAEPGSAFVPLVGCLADVGDTRYVRVS